MKTKTFLTLCHLALGLLAGGQFAGAQTSSSFTYQGRLDDAGRPATGLYEMTFALYDQANDPNPIPGASSMFLTPVTNGLFTVMLDFGSAPLNGSARWMQVSVRTNGSSAVPVALLPRAPLGSAPHATYAEKAGSVADGGISTGQLANYSITDLKLAPGAAVKSLNGLKDDVVLAAGSNITLATIGKTLTISSTGSGGGSAWAPTSGGIYYNAGRVGIGTQTPVAPLDVLGNWDGEQGGLNLRGNKPSIRFSGDAVSGNQSWLLHLGSDGPGNLEFFRRTGAGSWANALTMATSGNVGVGTTSPTEKLHVAGAFLRVEGAGGEAAYIGGDGWGADVQVGSLNPAVRTVAAYNAGSGTWMTLAAQDMTYFGQQNQLNVADNFSATVRCADFNMGHSSRRGTPGRALVDLGGELHVNFAGDWGKTVIGGCVTSVRALEITGGCDLAEPFQMSESRISEGSVVVIDEANPGHLKQATGAYDTRVAGIVSGANGINAGIALHQEGVLEGGQNVALTGRVYVKADASYGAIKPGDLLTTSNTIGHAMKVTDSTRAQGAILGKAMTALSEGAGMVLVLVSLQ